MEAELKELREAAAKERMNNAASVRQLRNQVEQLEAEKAGGGAEEDASVMIQQMEKAAQEEKAKVAAQADANKDKLAARLAEKKSRQYNRQPQQAWDDDEG
eukprot:COSAG04_NODE_10_length_43369_cov_4.059025_7_plen_101_part_00